MPPFLWIVTYIHTLVSSLMLRSIHSCSYFSIPYSLPSVSMLNVVYRYASQWNKVIVALHAGMHWPSLGSCVSALPTCECAPGDRRWDLSDIWRSWCQGHCMEAWQVCIDCHGYCTIYDEAMCTVTAVEVWVCKLVAHGEPVYWRTWYLVNCEGIPFLEWCWVMFSLLTVECDSFQVHRPYPYLKMWR